MRIKHVLPSLILFRNVERESQFPVTHFSLAPFDQNCIPDHANRSLVHYLDKPAEWECLGSHSLEITVVNNERIARIGFGELNFFQLGAGGVNIVLDGYGSHLLLQDIEGSIAADVVLHTPVVNEVA